jgi:formylglycine-generating enzyme required for sulfatase activity
MITAVLMALLALFSLFQYQNAEQANAAVEKELTAAEADLAFSRSISPALRLESLATLFEIKGIEARSNFWGLTQEEQLALFEVDNPRMALVVKGLLPSLADVNRSGYTADLLPVMADALARLPQSAEIDDMRTQLDGWIEARQLRPTDQTPPGKLVQGAQNPQFKTAVEKYRQLDLQNPAIRYELADLLAQMGEAEASLAQLDRLVELAQDPALAVAGTMLYRSDFATKEEMEQGARRLIKLHPDLGQALNRNSTDYPNLRRPGLVMTPTPTPVTEPDGARMVRVPDGSFTMGSNSGEADERPAHTVYLDGFYMDQYEVTNGQYAKCVDQGVCEPPRWTQSYNRPSYFGDTDYDDYPVIGVNWEQATTYCAWRGARLPTEAEWEKAARGTDERTYPWGELIDCGVANFGGPKNQGGCVGDTTFNYNYPTGVSPYGIYDLGGNLSEWTNDWYDISYYAKSPAENPQGPDDGTSKVLRGGSWGASHIDCACVQPGQQCAVRSVHLWGFGVRVRPHSVVFWIPDF